MRNGGYRGRGRGRGRARGPKRSISCRGAPTAASAGRRWPLSAARPASLSGGRSSNGPEGAQFDGGFSGSMAMSSERGGQLATLLGVVEVQTCALRDYALSAGGVSPANQQLPGWRIADSPPPGAWLALASRCPFLDFDGLLFRTRVSCPLCFVDSLPLLYRSPWFVALTISTHFFDTRP